MKSIFYNRENIDRKVLKKTKRVGTNVKKKKKSSSFEVTSAVSL